MAKHLAVAVHERHVDHLSAVLHEGHGGEFGASRARGSARNVDEAHARLLQKLGRAHEAGLDGLHDEVGGLLEADAFGAAVGVDHEDRDNKEAGGEEHERGPRGVDADAGVGARVMRDAQLAEGRRDLFVGGKVLWVHCSAERGAKGAGTGQGSTLPASKGRRGR